MFAISFSSLKLVCQRSIVRFRLLIAAADSLLQAKGFGETVVLISGEQATVICDLELDMASAGRIAGAVAECCGVSFENVIIVNR